MMAKDIENQLIHLFKTAEDSCTMGKLFVEEEKERKYEFSKRVKAWGRKYQKIEKNG